MPKPKKRDPEIIEKMKRTTLERFGENYYSEISKMHTPETRFMLFQDPEAAKHFGALGGKANKHERRFKTDKEAAREAGRLGAQKRWARVREAKLKEMKDVTRDDSRDR